MNSPAVSVLMSVYNAEPYLAEAVESILTQTFSDFEFLIIDDGSTDRSLEILQYYAWKDARIKLLSTSNRGISQAKNQLLSLVQGELIAIMDADDIALPERFALQVEFLQHHPEVVCVGGAHEYIDQKGRSLGHSALPETDAEIQHYLLGGIALIHHPCTMFRRSAQLQVGGYNEDMVSSEDLDLWLRLGEVGALVNLATPVLKYRIHQRSSSHQDQARQWQDAKAACERAWKRRQIQGEFVRDYTDRLNQHEFLLQCGWKGFASNQQAMAVDYGLRAVQVRPISRSSWKLLLASVLMPLTKVWLK